VKELMENAVDAGATRIDVAIEQGGLELIRISDDGCGLEPDQLMLAVASHATSKIEDADDLFRVGTLGFRGEALASIAEVSRLSLRSRTSQDTAGAQLDVAGGQAQPITPCGCPVGTTLEVRQLFYNTPVRRRFLRGTQTEMGHIGEAFTRIALAYPQLHCTLKHNDRTLHDLPPAPDWRARIGAFFGEDLARDLIAVDSIDGDVQLLGYAANPTHNRANPRMQYLFLNGRAIRDRALQHALGEAYRGLLLVGRYPIAFLRIALPAEMVDVNVHPTKLEVRFQDAGRLYSQLLGTLRSKFLATDLTPRVQTAGEGDGAAAHDADRAQQLRQELVDWAKGQLAQFSPAATGATAPATQQAVLNLAHDHLAHGASRRPLELVSLGRHWAPVGADRDEEPEPPELAALATLGRAAPAWTSGSAADGAPADTAASATKTTEPAWSAARAGAPTAMALQIHNRYLITESEEGVVVIDQHALHERILYEHLRTKVLAGALESQNLLVPEPVDLSPAESAAVLAARDTLAKLGIAIEPFGGDTVLVSSYPAMLANLNPAEILRDVVDRLLAGGNGPDRRDLVDELLHMISCKAAIKAGDRLTEGEIAALVEQRHLAQDSHHCPHGRPTALIFTRDELDRQFKRKG
ncbi:MAG TPA: DNA mismatch repair endonuclease MutL, partial [Pirellulales bacterium]|nr:DNA mismatch repair endonuclease MutL [Pirellulales bacterium]